MAFKASNVANVLLQTLDKLSSQGQNLVITAETGTAIETMVTVCNILVDSAESVAENTADPSTRDQTFAYAKKIKKMKFLCYNELEL